MRHVSGLFLCILIAAAAQGQDVDAESVIKRAINAAGGAESLKKFPAARITATGTLFPDDKTRIPVTAEQVWHVPGRSRATLKLEHMGQKLEVVHVVDGARAKYTMNGSPVPITEAARQDLAAAMTSDEIHHLLPLLADKKFLVKLDKMAKPDGNTVALLVTTRASGEFHLGFDRTTGHLIRLSRKAYDASTGKIVDQEQTFSDFKLFEGIVRPTKIVTLQDGKKTIELVTEKFTPLAAVDAKEFATE